MSDSFEDTPGLILSKIFKTLIYQLGVNLERYQYFMANFIRQLNITSNYKVSSLINNITKEIFNSSISWKVFIKALLFLGVTKFTIFLQKNEEAPIVSYDINLTDKTLVNSLFSFVEITNDLEEQKMGKHLKNFLHDILVKNSYSLIYSEAIRTYINKLHESGKTPAKSFKGNILKELKMESITWKVFIKALVVYGITTPTIGVVVYDKFNKHYTVSFGIDLGEISF